MKTILCTVGTSASKKLGIHPKKLEDWVSQYSTVQEASIALFKSFEDFKPELEENLTQHLSAEVHSLARLKISDKDRVLLFASETPSGHCCALAVKLYLETYWPNIIVEVEPIEGLQVDDPVCFQNKGVINFVKTASHYIESYGNGNVILNPTGGYKALVPYTVLIGMIKEVNCYYIFEQSTALLQLPPLPVEFRRSQFEAYRELFEEIDRESSISVSQWRKDMSYEDQKILQPLVEQVGDAITFSAVGLLFWDQLRSPSELVPFLSKKAIKDCFDNLSQVDSCKPFDFLNRVALSKELLRDKTHIPCDNGLFWLKPGSHTTDRYLVSIEGWKLLVWRAIREDQEGKNYPTKVTVDSLRDRSSYAPFMRMEYVQ